MASPQEDRLELSFKWQRGGQSISGVVQHEKGIGFVNYIFSYTRHTGEMFLSAQLLCLFQIILNMAVKITTNFKRYCPVKTTRNDSNGTLKLEKV